MKKENIEWEWFIFAGLVGSLVGLEEYAVRTKKIRPLSHLVWWSWQGKRELNRYVFGGAWTGFCVWTVKHFFIDRQND